MILIMIMIMIVIVIMIMIMIVIMIMIIHRESKVIVIPIVIGTLGAVSRNAKSWHAKFDIPDIVGSTQLSAILGTAHILRKVLCL